MSAVKMCIRDRPVYHAAAYGLYHQHHLKGKNDPMVDPGNIAVHEKIWILNTVIIYFIKAPSVI